MRRIVALLLALLLPTSALAATYCECPDAATHAAREEAIVRQLQAYRAVGASVALVKDGRIIDMFHYGRADKEEKIPVDGDTYFRIGSITKMVTAVGVLQLVEDGTLALDADLSDYFDFTVRNPRFPDVPVTLRQIMTHTASLLDTYHYNRATNPPNIEIVALRHVLDGNFTAKNFSNFTPGTKVDYSNFGGGIMGSLVEQVTGYTIDEYMQWKVFHRIGVEGGYHTPCLPYGARIANIYSAGSGSLKLDMMDSEDEHMDPAPDYNYVHTAGALCMTAEGLAKVIIALAGDGSVDGNRLLNPETVQEMRTRQNNRGSVTCDSDRGIHLNIIEDRIVKGRTLYGHQGKAYGMICAAYFDPTDGTGVVLLTNGCDDSTVNSVARIARGVIVAAYEYL